MKKLKVYIENSVIGGYFDEEFKEATKKLFEEFKKGTYKPVISSHVIDELENGAPQNVIDNLNTLDYEEFSINNESEDLAELYLTENIITRKYLDDALHIEVATVFAVDVLVSWNFKHIVNLKKIKRFNAVNLNEGYHVLEIRTPKELIYYD